MARPALLPLLLLPLSLPGAARASCAVDGGACICEDADGTRWDLSELGAGPFTTSGDTTGCTACVGNWNYHFALCGNVVMEQAIGCVSSQTRAAHRIDETSRWCEYMAKDATN